MPQNFFPLNVVQRSRLILRILFLLGLIAPLAIFFGIIWGIVDNTAESSVRILITLGGSAVLWYCILTLVSFLVVKRGFLSMQPNEQFTLTFKDNPILIPFAQISQIKIARQVRRFLQMKYWGQYPGATYRIFISAQTHSYLLEWDSSWNAKEGQKAVLGEDVVQAFIDAGVPKEKIFLNQKNWFWVLGLLFIGVLVWFVFFF